MQLTPRARSRRGSDAGLPRAFGAPAAGLRRALRAAQLIAEPLDCAGPDWLRSTIDSGTIAHQGYRLNLRWRMRIEGVFGWMKSSRGLRRTRFNGTARGGLAA
jgi:hypothetical protein